MHSSSRNCIFCPSFEIIEVKAKKATQPWKPVFLTAARRPRGSLGGGGGGNQAACTAAAAHNRSATASRAHPVRPPRTFLVGRHWPSSGACLSRPSAAWPSAAAAAVRRLAFHCRRRPRKATFKAKKCRKPLPAFFCRGYELESLSSSRTGGATPKTFMVNLFYSMLENFHLQLCVLLYTMG